VIGFDLHEVVWRSFRGNRESDLGASGRVQSVVGWGDYGTSARNPVVVEAIRLVQAKFEVFEGETSAIGGLHKSFRKNPGHGLTVAALVPFKV